MNKQICIQTVLTLVMVVGAISIGYTNFVQVEIKEDLGFIRTDIQETETQIDKIKNDLSDIKIDVKILIKGLES